MRLFYRDEGALDTLLQIADGPVQDGNLVSKQHRNEFVQMGWAVQCEGYSIITGLGRQVISALRLCRMTTVPAPAARAHEPCILPPDDACGCSPFGGITSAVVDKVKR